MNIKTKLNIFDKCFYLEDNVVIEDEVIGIRTNQIKDNSVDIYYILGKKSDKTERLVFKTKQELLDSL